MRWDERKKPGSTNFSVTAHLQALLLKSDLNQDLQHFKNPHVFMEKCKGWKQMCGDVGNLEHLKVVATYQTCNRKQISTADEDTRMLHKRIF